MAHRLQLGNLREQGRRRAAQMRRDFRGPRDSRRELRGRAAPRLAQFEYERFSRLKFCHDVLYAAARDGFMMSVRAPAYESMSAWSLVSVAQPRTAWPNS